MAFRRLLPLLLASSAACPPSPGQHDPPAVSTSITVAGHALVPQSTFMFDSPADYWSMVAITDHPAACRELSGLPACRPESWVGMRGYVDSPPSVHTALLIGFGFSWTQSPGFTGTPLGTYAVSTSCQFPFPGAGTGGANAAFMVRDDAGRLVMLDEAVGGTVVLEAMSSGRHAAGSYSLALSSGDTIAGEFAGDFCSAVAAHAQAPCCPEPWTYGWADESCTCGGVSASSSCSQPTPGGAWTCQCVHVDATTSTCTLPADARLPRGLCPQRYVTCCPMCP